MRHIRFDVATLEVEGVPVVLKAAYLLVAERPETPDLQWECVAFGLETETTIARGVYRVGITTLDGRELAGSAILVRSIEGAHVLRGDGPLEGLRPDELG